MDENGIYFKPWIGSDYENGVNGKKIMVLGHCHYCNDGSDDENFTINIMKGYIDWVKQGRPALSKDEKGKTIDLWVRTYHFNMNLILYLSGAEILISILLMR